MLSLLHNTYQPSFCLTLFLCSRGLVGVETLDRGERTKNTASCCMVGSALEEEISEGRMDGPGWLTVWLQIRTPPRREGSWEIPRSLLAWQSGTEPLTVRSARGCLADGRANHPATQPKNILMKHSY
jgi:hypothetical protein